MNRRPHEDALAARWSLEGEIPLGQVADGSSWHRARSLTSGENRVLYLVEGPVALEVADAARRVALVQNPRLLAVDDVEVFDDDGTPALTVVSYPFPPAPPLAAMLAEGPMRAETVRSVIGEAATGLEAARRRGLRHQHLDSNRVFLDTESGAVWVLGVGVETAAHGSADPSGPLAAHRDVAALVALAYRAVTGRSPRRDDSGNVPRAAQVTERRIPADLDALCDAVLNPGEASAPANVRELIAELGPWQSIPVTLEAYDADGGNRGPEPTARDGAAEVPADVDELVSPRPGPRPASSFPLSAGGAAVAAGSTAAGSAAAGSAAAGSSGAGSSAADPSAAAVGESDGALASTLGQAPEDELEQTPVAAPGDVEPVAVPGDVEPVAVPGDVEPVAVPGDPPDSAPEAPEDAASVDARRLVDELNLNEPREQAAFPAALTLTPAPEPVDPSPAEPAFPPASAATPAPVAAPAPGPDQGPSAPPADEGSIDGNLDHEALRAAAAAPEETRTPAPSLTSPTPSEPPSIDVSEATAVRDDSEGTEEPRSPVSVPGGLPRGTGPIVVPGREASIADGAPSAEAPRSSFRDVMGVAMDRDADQAPPAGRAAAPTRSRQSLWILLGAIIIVILALVLALTSITSGLRERMGNPFGGATPASSAAAPTQEPSSEPGTDAAPTPEPPAAGPPAIASMAIESSGSGDHADNADRLFDGDPGTVWRSSRYATASFGNLKDGIGIRIDLTAPATVNAVVVTTAQVSGGSLELRTVNDDGSMGDTVASGAFAGDGDVRLAPASPLQAQHLMLWIPQLPSGSDGNVAQIAEIRVE